METSTEISYDFSEDLAGERHIRALLGHRTMRLKVQLRTPEELLKPYTIWADELSINRVSSISRSRPGNPPG